LFLVYREIEDGPEPDEVLQRQPAVTEAAG